MLNALKNAAAQWGKPRLNRQPQPTQPDPMQSPDLPYDLVQQSLQRQLDAADALDTKMTNSLSGATALVALLAAVFALRQDSFAGASAACFYASLGILAVIAALNWFGTRIRPWRTGPQAEHVIQQYRLGVEEADVRWAAVRALVGSTEENYFDLAVKRDLLKLADGFGLVEVGLAVATLILLGH